MSAADIKKKRVLFLSTFITPFIEHDIRILRNFVDLHCIIARGIKAIFQIFRYIYFCDVVFCWFASVYSGVAVSLAKLLGKKTIVILAGVDVSADRETGYGIWLTAWKRPFVCTAIRKADKVLVVDQTLKTKAKYLARYRGDNIRYLPFSFDSSFFVPEKYKEKLILTVAAGADEIRIKTKGIDFLLQAAHLLPKIPFTIIGIKKSILNELGISVPGNVTVLPAMQQKKLLSYYQKAAVYCQPSRSEGLPNTLCEAMLCECIPVGTRVGGIPTAIGDTGFLVPYGEVEELKKRLQQALDNDGSLGKKARQRIMEEFPLERRSKGLQKVVLDTE